MSDFSDFEEAVHSVSSDLQNLGFTATERVTTEIADQHYFRKGEDAVLFFYLPKDMEFNFFVSRSGGARMDYPKPSSHWLYGTHALESALGRKLSEEELTTISSYVFRPTTEILHLYTGFIRQIFAADAA